MDLTTWPGSAWSTAYWLCGTARLRLFWSGVSRSGSGGAAARLAVAYRASRAVVGLASPLASTTSTTYRAAAAVVVTLASASTLWSMISFSSQKIRPPGGRFSSWR